MRDLEEAILEDPENVDILDATGRTALEWAAARGDEQSVTLLLSYGANPNTMDNKLNTPLTLAASQNHTTCVRLLLEAGADPDPELPAGVKFGTPLNCAARSASDPLLLKTLLDFNADVEASNMDMVTPLLHVARSQTASHAMLLLEYGANINATSRDGLTPLTTSIIYNNYGVLQLLLDRWFEYSECPRLKGPHLLELVALHADLKTMSILGSANHFKLKSDKDYTTGDFARRLRERQNVDQKLITAFEDLLNVIGQTQQMKDKSIENRMESGLLLHQKSSLEGGADDLDDVSTESPGSEQSFQDAQENLAVTSEEIFSLAKLLKKRVTM
jgi:ankyrin repeat protein